MLGQEVGPRLLQLNFITKGCLCDATVASGWCSGATVCARLEFNDEVAVDGKVVNGAKSDGGGGGVGCLGRRLEQLLAAADAEAGGGAAVAVVVVVGRVVRWEKGRVIGMVWL
ncbi:hypothetical protein VNO80_01316 [Phaseolus coccineus]|uniref:Uncharacterized protein n=1 Tax=Phaseolus coccineus TaxID=3886 RepID=A0AAN9RSN0_PHACN